MKSHSHYKYLLNQPSAIEEALQSLNSHQLLVEKAAASLARPSAIEQALQSFSSHQSLVEQAALSIARPSAMEQALQSFSSHQSLVEKVAASLARPSAIEEALSSLNAHQSSIDREMASFLSSPELEDALIGFGRASSVLLSDPEKILDLYVSINSWDSSLSDRALRREEVDASVNRFGATDNAESYFFVFRSLPPLVQALLFYFLIHVFLPHVNSISANLLTPIVESYIQESGSTQREKIKEIKSIPLCLDGVSSEGLRFITGNNVRLRSGPSTKSEVLDELVLGQVVTVLSKNRNWIEVMYEYEEGDLMSGWVFSRYTSKFIR